jgi:hypothetical protein
MADTLEIKMQEIIEALSGSPNGNPPPETEDKLKWYLDEIINLLKRSDGDSVRYIEPVTDTWTKTGRKYAGKDIWRRRFTGNLACQEDGDAGSVPNYFKDTLLVFADNGANIHIQNIFGEIVPNHTSIKITFPSSYYSVQYYYSMGGYIDSNGNLILNYCGDDIATDVLIAYDVCVEIWTEDGDAPA